MVIDIEIDILIGILFGLHTYQLYELLHIYLFPHGGGPGFKSPPVRHKN